MLREKQKTTGVGGGSLSTHLDDVPFQAGNPPLGPVRGHAHVDRLVRQVDLGERLDELSVESFL